MNHEVAEAAQGRLRQVRETLASIKRTFTYGSTLRDGHGGGYPVQIERRLSEEEVALVDLLVGEDPLVHDSLRWLRERYAEHCRAIFGYNGSERVCEVPPAHDGPHSGPLVGSLAGRRLRGDMQIVLGGNEVWVFADVQIDDDYGEFDFEVRHAIFRNTGALYRIERDGSVADDPIYVPEGSTYTGLLEDSHGQR